MMMLKILTMPTLMCCSLSTVGPRVSSGWVKSEKEREREIPIRQHPVCVDSGTIGARAGGRSESKWIFSGIMPPEPDSVSLWEQSQMTNEMLEQLCLANWQQARRTWAKLWPRIIHELLITSAIIIFHAERIFLFAADVKLLHYWWSGEWWDSEWGSSDPVSLVTAPTLGHYSPHSDVTPMSAPGPQTQKLQLDTRDRRHMMALTSLRRL